MASGPGLPFSLRPLPSGSRKPKNLAEFIARANAQNGGFRTVHEEDLRGLLESEKHDAHDSARAEADGPHKEEDDKGAVVDIRAARDEILGNIEIAYRNAMLTLDFVSLLLTKETPVQAGMTLSPDLRQMVGIGTLGATNLSASNLTQARIQENKLVATGRKLLDINKAADSILSAASRLQEEISLETKYWAEALAVSDNGWAVSRMPQEPHAMGVKFGFSESGGEFRANSLAPLRRAEDGSVDLDTGKMDNESKRLLVSIETDGKVVGRSSLPQPLPSDAPLEHRVLEARDSIFSRELWHEVNREGRTLLSYNIRVLDDSVVYAASADTKIVLRLVDLGGGAGSDSQPGSAAEDGNAETIRTLLYLLMSYAHRQNGRRRAQSTAPLNPAQSRAANAPHGLLRPILAYLQFESSLRRCIGFLSDLTAILQSAGITTASYEITEYPIRLNPSLPVSESLLGTLLSPLKFRAELTITADARLEIVGSTFTTQYITSTFQVTLLPPARTPDQQEAAAHHPLVRAFPPADLYPNLDEVFTYARQSVPRILAMRYERLASEWTASRGPSDAPPPVGAAAQLQWAATVDGTGLRDCRAGLRGVHFALSACEAAAGGADALRPRELRATGEFLEDGKLTQKHWTWATEKGRDAAQQETLEDAVREVLLGGQPAHGA